MTAPNPVMTLRFGEVAVTSEDVVTFPDGLVGLPRLKQFVLIEHKPGSEFRWLQSLDDPSVAFLVVDPASYVSDYAPDMPEGVADALEIGTDTPVLVYTVCSIPNGNPKGMTLNLAGPVVINAERRMARQVVLEDAAYTVRHPAFPEEYGQAA